MSQAQDFRKWGFEALDRIQVDLLMPDGSLYGESAEPGERPTAVSFNWGVGVMLSALNAAARADPAYKPRLARFVEATRGYWSSAPPVAGYDMLPRAKNWDRYYDDNEWMVLALVEASQVLGSTQPLEYAKQAFHYVMSGEDSKLGGGIYWRERTRDSKNTCSNGPAAAAALELFRRTHERSYLETAERIYAWTRSHLRDPSDGLYWDNISLSGKVDKTKWSYNSGLMLRDAAELYSLTKAARYAADAREIQRSSLKHWVGPNGALRDEGKFMHLLTENWLRAYALVPGSEDPRPAIAAGLEFLHAHGRDSLGHYGSRWDEPRAEKPHSPFSLIDQASVVRGMLLSAAGKP